MRRGAAEQHEKHYKEDVLGKCGGFRWSSLSIRSSRHIRLMVVVLLHLVQFTSKCFSDKKSVRMGMVAMQAYRAVFLRCRLLPMA